MAREIGDHLGQRLVEILQSSIAPSGDGVRIHCGDDTLTSVRLHIRLLSSVEHPRRTRAGPDFHHPSPRARRSPSVRPVPGRLHSRGGLAFSGCSDDTRALLNLVLAGRLRDHSSLTAPVLARRSISTTVIAERIDAGEAVDELAADYDLAVSEVEEAVLYERAA
jgi:hypothetical protein